VEFVSNVYLVGGEKVIQCNIRDITERKQAQDALLKSQALLRELSVRDHLTGLFNRRYMEETLERELLRASRKGLSLGILMMDVDDFKQFNDNFGHAAGDAVLRELGDLLIGHFRGEDIACRYGGDEFIIVLLDASLDMTRERAERLCEHARHLDLQFEGQTLQAVTLSVGVAAFPENGITSVAILKAADTALYRAKREGRGRVVVAN
jgi:diguanylate cyclase (GGDEF)-like protein